METAAVVLHLAVSEEAVALTAGKTVEVSGQYDGHSSSMAGQTVQLRQEEDCLGQADLVTPRTGTSHMSRRRGRRLT